MKNQLSVICSQTGGKIKSGYCAPVMGARAQHTLKYRRLCALLRKWRDDAGLTQRELAKRLRKPHSYVHKVEVADRRIDPVEFVAWCRACDRSPSRAIIQIDQ